MTAPCLARRGTTTNRKSATAGKRRFENVSAFHGGKDRRAQPDLQEHPRRSGCARHRNQRLDGHFDLNSGLFHTPIRFIQYLPTVVSVCRPYLVLRRKLIWL